MAISKEHKPLIFQEGVAFIIGGVAAIILPLIYNMKEVTALGWILIAVGGYKAAQLFFHERGATRTWVPAAIAISYLGVGVWLVSQPKMSWMVLAIALSALFAVAGVLFVKQAWTWRANCDCWAWLLLAGLISVAAAALMWTAWADRSVWVTGLLLGIQLISYGLALTLMNFPGCKHRH